MLPRSEFSPPIFSTSSRERLHAAFSLRSYYRGHRGVDIFGGSSIGASRKRAASQLDMRPGSASSEFRQALTSLDPTQFQPEGAASSLGVGAEQASGDDNDSMMSAGDEDYRESQSEGGSSSLAVGHTVRSGMRGSRADVSNMTLSLARKQLVRMQDDKRRRAVARQGNRAFGQNEQSMWSVPFDKQRSPNSFGTAPWMDMAP